MTGPTLHLVRPGAEPAGVADGDWLVALERLELANRGTPPIPPGPLQHEQLVQLVFAARRVITW